MAFDNEADYIATSAFRFLKKGSSIETLQEVYRRIKEHESVDLNEYMSSRGYYETSSC